MARETRTRLLNRDGTFNARREGVSLTDRLSPYQTLLTMSWPAFLSLFVAAFIATNAIFALAFYLLGPAALSAPNLQPLGGRFMMAFFFSIETFSTIGYGNILPNGLLTNLIVSAESAAGILFVALATGVIFARFSRPLLHLRFSDHAIMAPYRDGMALMFRVGNTRRSELVGLTATVTFARFQDCDGEERMRAFDQLSLERSGVLFFPLTWTIVHPIDEHSPLHGLTQEDLVKAHAEFLVLVSATEETFSQLVHTRTSYTADEVRWGVKFGNIYTPPTPEGLVQVDLRRIDAVVAADLPVG
ncbi:MAG TPA: ion channel [Gemmatimonadaceae bacterium]|nr:ion channel [Gemmatimonadaceae bacterium]